MKIKILFLACLWLFPQTASAGINNNNEMMMNEYYTTIDGGGGGGGGGGGVITKPDTTWKPEITDTVTPVLPERPLNADRCTGVSCGTGQTCSDGCCIFN